MNHIQIAAHLSMNKNHVRYALKAPDIEPNNSTNRPPTITTRQVDEIRNFNISSDRGHGMLLLELNMGPLLYFVMSEKVVENEINRRGYERLAFEKPPKNGENKKLKLCALG